MIRFSCALAFASLLSAAPAAAQSQWCLDFIDSYCGPLAVNECLVPDMIPYEVPGECIGDVQMLYEMANEADAQYYQDPHAYQDTPSMQEKFGEPELPAYDPGGSTGAGYSYGGNLREGPGDNYGIVGSIGEGTWISMEPSGVWSGDYQWFWVSGDFGAAYQWGGLMCSMDYYLDGVLSVC